jgi:hypothetical protein
VLLLAYGMTWAQAQVPLVGGIGAARQQDLTGRDLQPLAAVCGWVALAGVAGVLATRGWGRSAVATVVLVAGVGGLAGAVTFALDPDGAAIDASSVTATQAWVLAAAGGILVVVAACWTIARGRSWPVMGTRYERGATSRPERSAWDLQDMGQDPTQDK